MHITAFGMVSTSRLSQDKHRCFRLSSDDLSRQLSGEFNPDVWSCLIPPASESHPSIRHALVAIGAVSKLMLTHNHRYNAIEGILEAKTHHEFALRQYSRASQSLRDTTASGKQKLRITLLTCWLSLASKTFMETMQQPLSKLFRALVLSKTTSSIMLIQVSRSTLLLAIYY